MKKKDNSVTKVLIAMPCGSGTVPSLMVTSLLQLHKPCPCAFLIVDRQRVDKCRNYFVKECLEKGFDYLMMVDDDNPIPPDSLEILLKDNKDIVIAPILTRNPNKEGKHDLCAYYKADIDVGNNVILPYYNFVTKFRDAGPLHRIDAGGCGCILIKREVLEVVSKAHDHPFEFGNEFFNGQRRTTSEDVEFGERAIKLGFELWLDERVKPFHLGNQHQVMWGGFDG